jgi:hypothetical protein
MESMMGHENVFRKVQAHEYVFSEGIHPALTCTSLENLHPSIRIYE